MVDRRIKIKKRATGPQGVDPDSFRLGYQTGWREAEVHFNEFIVVRDKEWQQQIGDKAATNRQLSTVIEELSKVNDDRIAQIEALERSHRDMAKQTRKLLDEVYWWKKNATPDEKAAKKAPPGMLDPSADPKGGIQEADIAVKTADGEVKHDEFPPKTAKGVQRPQTLYAHTIGSPRMMQRLVEMAFASERGMRASAVPGCGGQPVFPHIGVDLAQAEHQAVAAMTMQGLDQFRRELEDATERNRGDNGATVQSERGGADGETSSEESNESG